ncbi:MAG: glycosyltransferase family 2 protein [Defluviitaleaceae bacterium]|nr:glycosyltransferase family 2 protein [Defluviitaleaceae bacterium]
MDTPLVSIIMPAHNAAATIRESIDSVLAQTYPHWELIIVNDASRDTTLQIIQSYAAQNENLHIYTNTTNQGASETRNIAIRQAQGEYLAFLDSDDLWHPEKLAQQINFMQENNATLSFTATAYLAATGEPSPYTLTVPKIFTLQQLLRSNLMSHSSVIIQRTQMLPYPKGFLHEDYAVWLQILKKIGHAHGLNQPLLTYRLQAQSKSAKRIDSAIMIYNAYRHAQYNRIKAFLYTLRYARHSISKRNQINRPKW